MLGARVDQDSRQPDIIPLAGLHADALGKKAAQLKHTTPGQLICDL